MLLPHDSKDYTKTEVEAEKLISFLKSLYGIDFVQRAHFIEIRLEHFRSKFYPLSSCSWDQLRQFVLRRYIGGLINLSDAVYTAFTTVPELYQLAADEMFEKAQAWPDPYFPYSWTYSYFYLGRVAEHFSDYSMVICPQKPKLINHMNVNYILFQLKS